MVQVDDQTRRARVFISCGQTKDSDELTTAKQISYRLSELGFDPYIAVEEQTLRGLTENIFPRLRDSEYFVFVDFKREKLVPHGKSDVVGLSEFEHRGSLFSHQELALASFLDLPLLAFQEVGVKKDDGVLRFLQANATPFTNRSQLPNVIADEVERLKWNPSSRNELLLERVKPPWVDATEVASRELRRFFHIEVRNLHHKKTATNCYVYLEKATKLAQSSTAIPFGSVESKWAGYVLPNAHILPSSARRFDALFIAHRRPTEVRFPTFTDSSEFGCPPLLGAGEYELCYAVVSDNFPIARVSLKLTVSDRLDGTTLKLNA